MEQSLIISKNSINFSNNVSTNQTSTLYLINHTNEDFIFKFLVKDNNLCYITPSKEIIEKNNSKEIKININQNAINRINKIIIYALNTKYINIKDTKDIWTIYKHLIEKYTIEVQYNEQNNNSYNFCIYLYIVVFILIILFLLGVYFFF